MIYLIPRGKRTYGRVIWEGTFADVPVTLFLVYAEERLNLKRDFNSHWVLNLGQSCLLIIGLFVMKCNFSLSLTVLKLFTTEYKSSVVQLEKYC